MKNAVTKTLKEDVATALVQNAQWFAGYSWKINKIKEGICSVTMPEWQWSSFVISKEDYAK